MVPFSNCDSEQRIIEIVRAMVNNEEIEEYASFFNEPQKKKDRRKRKWKQEQREAERLNVSDDDLVAKIQKEQERREQNMDSFLSKLEAKYGGKGVKRKSLKNTNEGQPSKMKTRSKK